MTATQKQPDRLPAGLPDGGAIWRAAFVRGARPDPPVDVAAWAEECRVLAQESSPLPGRWRNATTPYGVEVMQCLSPAHPARRVVAKKAAQMAFTDFGLNWLGAIIDRAAGPSMVIQPTGDSLKKFEKTKLDPCIRETPALVRKVRTQKSRDASGSTTTMKRFPGGFLSLGAAHSSTALQMISVRNLMKDELSEWVDDAGSRGDPSDQADRRTDAFSRTAKIYEPSTPAIKGKCRISAKYEESDQRRWYMPCPHCGHRQVLKWDAVKWDNPRPPHGAHMQCRNDACGGRIVHHHKRAMLAAGEWLKTWPEEDGSRPPDVLSPGDAAALRARDSGGRYPGFHISQLCSPFKDWDAIVGEWLQAEGRPRKEKTFWQQVLGEAWEEASDAPDWEALYARRAEWRMGALPTGALVITVGIDVGKDYFVYEVIGWGIGETSYSIDAGKIYVRDTGDLACWDVVDELLSRTWPDWNGVLRGVDQAAIDSGFNTHVVYQYVRRRGGVMAVDGRDGHAHPIVGKPVLKDIRADGRTIRKGVRVWPIGTWPIKSELYANLRKQPPAEGSEQFPLGYCHFSADHEGEYFEELVNERLDSTIDRYGREVMRWVRLGPNHYLDCRVYARAAAERLGMSRWTLDRWRQIAADRDAPEEDTQLALGQLFDTLHRPAAAPEPAGGPRPKTPDAPGHRETAARQTTPRPTVKRPTVRRPTTRRT